MLMTEVKNVAGVDWDDANKVSETRFRWIIEVEVSGTWVQDGFDLNNETIEERLSGILPYAYSHEKSFRVLKAPNPELIRRAQGYAD